MTQALTDPSPSTLVIATVSFGFYLTLLWLRVIKNKLDFSDFLLLSAICLIPAAFLYIPGFSSLMVRLTGVSFPFLILFGAVILCSYLYTLRLAIRINDQKLKLARMAQEFALLRAAIEFPEAKSENKNLVTEPP